MKYEKLEKLHDRLVEHYRKRNELYDQVDDHVHSIWELPEEIKDVSWMRTVKTTDPADAIATTVRTFATHSPKFRLTPMANNAPNRQRANEIEQILRWHWKRASQRSEVRPLWDIVESAARYAMVACQVVYLPCQFETFKTMGTSDPRAKAALSLGPYAIVPNHPSGIYPQYSSLMLEGVLSVRQETADDFCSFWGDRAKKLKSALREDGNMEYVTVWDYTDYEERVVFAFIAQKDDEDSGKKFEIVNEVHGLPFLPWIVKKWGNTLDSSSKERVNPMLGSLIEAGQWPTQNVLESIGTSLVIQRSAHPVAYDETPNGEGLDVDYSEPATTVHGRTGMTKYQPLPAPSIDPQIAAYTDRMGARMSKATVARVLQNLDFPSGTPYSSVNQILDAAMSAIAPFKLLAQDAVAGIAKNMLEWASFWKDDLTGYGSSKSTMGKEYTLKWDEFDPKDLDIEVTLTPYVPIDQVALLNAGILGNKNLKIPLGRIQEDIGIEDPENGMNGNRNGSLRQSYKWTSNNSRWRCRCKHNRHKCKCRCKRSKPKRKPRPINRHRLWRWAGRSKVLKEWRTLAVEASTRRKVALLLCRWKRELVGRLADRKPGWA